MKRFWLIVALLACGGADCGGMDDGWDPREDLRSCGGSPCCPAVTSGLCAQPDGYVCQVDDYHACGCRSGSWHCDHDVRDMSMPDLTKRD